MRPGAQCRHCPSFLFCSARPAAMLVFCSSSRNAGVVVEVGSVVGRSPLAYAHLEGGAEAVRDHDHTACAGSFDMHNLPFAAPYAVTRAPNRPVL